MLLLLPTIGQLAEARTGDTLSPVRGFWRLTMGIRGYV